MEDKEVLGVLDELDADDKAREARMRGRARIREVITRYLEVLKLRPQIEANLVAEQKNFDEVSDRLKTQLAGLRNEVITARGALTLEKEMLEKERLVINGKRSQLQQEFATFVKDNDEKIRLANIKRHDVEQSLTQAETALKEFRKKHVNV